MVIEFGTAVYRIAKISYTVLRPDVGKMRKVKCQMTSAEKWCGTVGKMRNGGLTLRVNAWVYVLAFLLVFTTV